VLDTDELLSRLDAKGIRNVEIARVLNLPDSRIPEIRRKDRALKLDEAAKLVREFALERDSTPLPNSIMRLFVQYMADQLGARLESDQLEELMQDVRVFSAFVADPKVRRSVEAAEGFFQALRLRRPVPESTDPQETDPERTH
jgi:hypothetical protein